MNKRQRMAKKADKREDWEDRQARRWMKGRNTWASDKGRERLHRELCLVCRGDATELDDGSVIVHKRFPLSLIESRATFGLSQEEGGFAVFGYVTGGPTVG